MHIKLPSRNYKKRTKYFFYTTQDLKLFSLWKLWNHFLNKSNYKPIFYMCLNVYRYFFNLYNKKIILTNLIPLLIVKTNKLLKLYRTIFKTGFFYLRALLLIFIIDALFTDDEPLWEPIEWSLVMTWILFIFIFAWVAENLITSRYGSFVGRDKRVWFGWFKTFWLLNSWFALSYGTAAMFVILPFYSELVYPISFSFSWWNWYTRIFFYKFVSFYSIILICALYTQLSLRWMNWKKLMFFCVIINFSLAFLVYTHTIMTFFAYFTDPLWYQKTKIIDYVQLSHEPWKWGWGPAKRDHFSYHKVSTVFWFKNDGPYAGAFLLIQSFFFISLVLLYTYWLVLLRRVYSTQEISVTFYVYCVSALRQFFLCFFMFYLCVFLSFFLNYWRAPIEFTWLNTGYTWGFHFLTVFFDYFTLLISLFF